MNRAVLTALGLGATIRTEAEVVKIKVSWSAMV
jgi:hypothetical protein